MSLPLPDDASADPALAAEYVGLLNFANRAALATGISHADDPR